ncbi:GNAT family N-acetyltransferase [Eoetvoesiella caeni]|uniref:EVE domain-containing protein n=1 Tax=Eoetvoesiella caeni TaxID=645616 RepID=A0A366HK89_9BURK|nr:GNAT family N-acetyltransferase [Eoetvoesiella caeni]MCI2808177.1 EVE domain-containing protein [Eoetvoesiella caeni]NYT53820.1 EVE domain-containing protein [Eoetvoesiella caeni]RBP42100.1 EVE domain-containing protein [Eoetvoesiella caeni]
MAINAGMIKALTEPSTVSEFLGAVAQAADSDRDALGFFPRSVYGDFCRKGQLFVARESGSDGGVYAGHLLFDLRFPKAHVRQIYVPKTHRGRKIGQKLLTALKSMLTDGQFISIHARVAEDLRDANKFWEAQGFYAQRVEVGGGSRNRIIVVRAHELDTPQLFASSGISAADPLGLDAVEGGGKPLYLLDLNVFFDLGPRRPRHELAMSVFRAERMQACSLAVSSEIETELNRTAHDGKTDPMLSFVGTLAKFSRPPAEEWARLMPMLATLVFSERYASGSLSDNDRSDLMHLATAIYHGLSGLITSDIRILDRAPELRQQFSVDAISPELFQAEPAHTVDPVVHEMHSTDIIEVQVASSTHTAEIRRLLTTLCIDNATQVHQWAATDSGSSACVRHVALLNGVVAGYIVLPAKIRGNEIRAHVAVDELQESVHEIAQSLLLHVLSVVGPGEVGRIRLSCPPRQASLREVAATFGYVASTSMSNDLQKIVAKGRFTERNWAATRDSLAAVGKLGLPDTPPAFRHIDQQVSVIRPDSQKVLVSIFKLESLLAPMLLCLPGREGVMVPIRKHFEEHLLADSPQDTFLPRGKAQLAPLRHYLSDKKTMKNFARGDLLFFYESGKNKGAGAVIAVGRVLRAYLRDESAMQAGDLAPSVLDRSQLSSIGVSKTKTITVFDNILRLPRPVPLHELRSIGCGEAHQLITSQRLSSEQVQAILDKGL